ncbi:angiopoietin-related protein 7-like [Drosophila subpulchrella]|uniref:angiopoietin-related protein 7-like n=1 Tax=Drosophila subpulchrella TaxID=1486046 RepID=UPI0018A16868|nr:angiopoietin-related protein 7-like [Drosophila subpulchrella]
MNSVVLVFILTISALDRLSVIDAENSLQENLETKCRGYCFSVFKPALDRLVLVTSKADNNDELNEQLVRMSGTVNELKSQLKSAKITYREELIKLKNDLINENEQLKIKYDKVNQLAIAECQIKINDLISAKDKELNEKNAQIKSKDEQIIDNNDKINSMAETNKLKELLVLKDKEISENQIKSKDEQIAHLSKEISDNNDKINTLTETVTSLQSQLKDAKNQLKISENILNITNKEINDKSEQLQSELSIKKSEVKDLSAQILAKDDQISDLNHQILKHIGLENCPKSGPSGIYPIKLNGKMFLEAPCNSTGWLIIQRRQDGSENFARSWSEYKNGFGNITGEFFIGLENLHKLTNSRTFELSFKLGNVKGDFKYALYDNFKIGNEAGGYRLQSIGTYSGTAGDSLRYNLNVMFHTFDRDDSCKCAQAHSGGWWYRCCSACPLNGEFHKNGKSRAYMGINWHSFHNDVTTSLTFVEMMIRPKL